MDDSNIKVLVIEDDADINRLLCRMLTGEGLTAVSAFSGSEASLRLSLEAYQLVLMDLMLPGILWRNVDSANPGTIHGSDHCHFCKKYAGGQGGAAAFRCG